MFLKSWFQYGSSMCPECISYILPLNDIYYKDYLIINVR